MKKMYFFLGVILLVLGCSGLKTAQKNLKLGQFDQVIRFTSKKLSKNLGAKKKKKYVDILQESFIKAVKQDKEQLNYLRKDLNPDNTRKIYQVYQRLISRQEFIKPLLPLQGASFDIEDYTDQHIESKQNHTEQLYTQADAMLSNSAITKSQARLAYQKLQEVDHLHQNYKFTAKLLEKALHLGTDYVYLNLTNQTQQILPQRLAQELMDFDTYGLDTHWTLVHNTLLAQVDYDYKMELQFQDIVVSPERTDTRTLQQQKVISDGLVNLVDESGNEVLDQDGNIILVENQRTVECVFNEFSQYKEVQVQAKVLITNLKTRQLIDQFDLASKSVFDNVYANYSGDLQAIDTNLHPLVKQQFVTFPTDEQMIYDTQKDLKQQLKRKIESWGIFQ